MSTTSDDMARLVTSRLSDTKLWDLGLDEPEASYRPVPFASPPPEMPVWRLRFELAFDPKRALNLDVNGEVALGRGEDAPDNVSLAEFDADELGVSRRHVLLRPEEAKLYVLDLDSTNGTRRNGRSIGVQTPYSLSNGDILTLGKLELIVRIVRRPSGHTALLKAQEDLADTLPEMARSILSQLDMGEVLKQALEVTCSIVPVDEVSIWLVDEQSGDLYLEAERGIADAQIRQMRLPVADTLPGKVIATGKPLRVHRQAGGEQVKVKTGYLVDAVIYVPLTLGGVTFGVLSAAHREGGRSFTQREERLMAAIADFTAIAVQNARQYTATERALGRRTKALTALNNLLSYDVKQLLNAVIGYAGLLESSAADDYTGETAHLIAGAGNRLTHLAEQMLEMTRLCENPVMHRAPCDLVEIANRAARDLYTDAVAKAIRLDVRVMGEPYLISGDEGYLYRSLYNLLDNGIRYCPRGAHVSAALAFGINEVIVRVRDTGRGVAAEDLPYLFDRYFRDAHRADGMGGIGLGLEVVRATAEAHRGTVSARNAEGGGAEFIMTLPAALRVE